MSDTSDFGTFGRFVETPVDVMSPEMKDACDFTRQLRGLVPGPHKIWLANPTLSKTIVPSGAYFQRQPLSTAPATMSHPRRGLIPSVDRRHP